MFDFIFLKSYQVVMGFRLSSCKSGLLQFPNFQFSIFYFEPFSSLLIFPALSFTLVKSPNASLPMSNTMRME